MTGFSNCVDINTVEFLTRIAPPFEGKGISPHLIEVQCQCSVWCI
jgi:hypothetical protein